MTAPITQEDWQELVDACNRFWDTDYQNSKDLLEDLYVTRNLGFTIIVKQLGISPGPIKKELRRLGIPIRPRGGSNHVVNKCHIALLNIPTERRIQMTSMQLSKETGFGPWYVRTTLKRYGLKYNKFNRGQDKKGVIKNARKESKAVEKKDIW